MKHGFDISFAVKAVILGTFACALWVGESIMTAASVYVIWLHRRQRQAESSVSFALTFRAMFRSPLSFNRRQVVFTHFGSNFPRKPSSVPFTVPY